MINQRYRGRTVSSKSYSSDRQKLTNRHPFNRPFFGTTRVNWQQTGKTNLDFTEARDSEWQWHQLGHMQVCTSLQRFQPWPCVCTSVISQSSAKTAERIELVFGMWASFHPSYTVLKGNSVISKSKGTSFWNFVLNSGHRKFCHGISIVKTCYRLSSRKVDAPSLINWAIVGQLSW